MKPLHHLYAGRVRELETENAELVAQWRDIRKLCQQAFEAGEDNGNLNSQFLGRPSDEAFNEWWEESTTSENWLRADRDSKAEQTVDTQRYPKERMK